MPSAKHVYAAYLVAYVYGPPKLDTVDPSEIASKEGQVAFAAATALGVAHRESDSMGPLHGRELCELVTKMCDVG